MIRSLPHRWFALALAPALLAAATVSAAVWTWTPAGAGDGGTTTSVAVQTVSSGNPVVLVGGDVFGINRSTEAPGKGWRPSNGFLLGSAPGVASVMWDPNDNSVAYAATNSGIYWSTDAGADWSLLANSASSSNGPLNIVFSGNGAADHWPRPIGKLLAIDWNGTTGWIYAGMTYYNSSTSAWVGVLLSASYSYSAQGGPIIGQTSPWSVVSHYTGTATINSIAIDPVRQSSMFVATNGDGLLCTTWAGSGAGGGWSSVSGLPAEIQSVTVVPNGGTAGTVYASGGTWSGNTLPTGSSGCGGAGSHTGSNGTWSSCGVWSATFNSVWGPATALQPPSGATSPHISAAIFAETPWTLAGYYDSFHSKTVLYAGALNPPLDNANGCYDAVIECSDGSAESTNGNANWNVVSGPGNLGKGTASGLSSVYDSNGVTYWQADTGGNSQYILGAAGLVGVGDIEVVANTANGKEDQDNLVLLACESGLWGTNNADDSQGQSVLWYPFAGGYYPAGSSLGSPGYGLAAHPAHFVAPDPTRPGVLYQGSGDWSFFVSTDSGATFQRRAPTNDQLIYGKAFTHLYLDASPSGLTDGTFSPMVYAAITYDSEQMGTVMSCPDPTQASAVWTDMGLGQYLTQSGLSNKVESVVAGRDAATNGHVVVLAMTNYNCSTESGGMFYHNASGDGWQALGPATNDPQMTAASTCSPDFSWNPGSAFVYVFANGGTGTAPGLYYSPTYGLPGSWHEIWKDPTNNPIHFSGHMVADPSNANTFYISDASHVYRLDYTSPGVGLTLTDLGFPAAAASPGALLMSNGCLYCATIAPGDGPNPVAAGLYACQSAATATSSTATWTLVSGNNTTYSTQSNWPESLAMDAAGTMDVGNAASSVTLGAPLFSDNFTLLQTGSDSQWTAQLGTWGPAGHVGSWDYAGSGQCHDQQSNSTLSTSYTYLNTSLGLGASGFTAAATIVPLGWTTGTQYVGVAIDSNPDSAKPTDYTQNRYTVELQNYGTYQTLAIKKESSGTITTLATSSQLHLTKAGVGESFTLALSAVASGSDVILTAYMNGQEYAQGQDNSPLNSGTVGLVTCNATADFSDVYVTAP